MRLILVLCLLLLAIPAAAAARRPRPAATTGAASGVDAHDARPLNGTVDPNGTATSYHFEYGTTTAYGLAVRRRRRRRRRRPRARVDGRLQGLSAGHDLPLPGRRHQRRRRPPTGADRTFRTRLRRRALPGITSHRPRARSGPTQRLAAQPRSTPTAARRATTSSTGSRPSYGSRTPERAIGAGDSRVAVAERDRRPAAVPPLPLPRRGDQRGGAQRAAATARSRRSARPTAITLAARRAAHARGARGSRCSAASRGARRERRSRSRSSARTSRSPARSPSIGAPAPVRADRDGSFRFFVPDAVLRHPPARGHAHGGRGGQPGRDRQRRACRSARAVRRATRRARADPRLRACRPCRTGAPCSSA